MRVTFVHLSGSKRGRAETLDLDRIRIGSDPGNEIAFDPAADAPVRPFHAAIQFANCEFILTDLRGSGGTFVNDRQVEEVILQDGDVLEFGLGGPKVRFRVRPEERAACLPFRDILDDSKALARATYRGPRVDFQAVAEELARRKLIRPATTGGFLGDVQPHQLTYDAQTAAGGSGGPLFDERGRVIAVNFAVLQGFPGANYGVPIRLALDLLGPPPPKASR